MQSIYEALQVPLQAIQHYMRNLQSKRLISQEPLSAADLLDMIKAQKVDINYSEDGVNPLHIAAIMPFDQEERIALLLTQENVNMQTEHDFNNTPLHLLIANENSFASKLLIGLANSKHIYINYKLQDANGRTPLLLAARLRQENIALVLVRQYERGEDIGLDMVDKNGYNAFDYAIVFGQVELAQKLFELGARPSKVTTSQDVEDFGKDKLMMMLQEVEINGTRDERAAQNFIHDENHQSDLIMYIDFTPIPIRIPSTKNEDNKQRIQRLDDLPIIDSSAMVNQHEMTLLPLARKKTFLYQYESFSGKSLVDACLEGQRTIKAKILSCKL